MKIAQLVLAAALALGAMAGVAQATTITVNFTVSSTAGSTVLDSGAAYGQSTPFTLNGTADVTKGDTSGNSFTALSFTYGTKTFGLADIDTASSHVDFNSNGSFKQFELEFLTTGNFIHTNNTFGAHDAGGTFLCNDCVAATAVTPVPASLVMLGTALLALGGFAFARRRLGLSFALPMAQAAH
jgi:hypothetical protein